MIDPFMALQNVVRSQIIVDALVPFIIFFVLIYSALKNVKIIEKQNQRIALAIAITVAIIFPHIAGSYPRCWDPINMMNLALPKISFFIFILIGILVILAVFGGQNFLGNLTGVLSIIAIIYVFYVVLSSVGGAVAPDCAIIETNFLSPEWLRLISIFGGAWLIWWFVTRN
jgi:hypothetical protein